MPRAHACLRIQHMRRVVDGNGSFPVASGDELELAQIVNDIAGGIDVRQVRLHEWRDLDRVPFEVEAPFSDRSKVRLEPEQRDHRIYREIRLLFRFVVQHRHAGDAAAVPGDGGNLIRRKAVSYTHLRAHETDSYLVCRL